MQPTRTAPHQLTHSAVESRRLGLVPAVSGSPSHEFPGSFKEVLEAVRLAQERFVLWMSARAGYALVALGDELKTPTGRVAFVAPGDVKRVLDYFLRERSAIGLSLSEQNVRDLHFQTSLSDIAPVGRETHTATVVMAAYADGKHSPIAFALSRVGVTVPTEVQTEQGLYACPDFAREAAPLAKLDAELAVSATLPEHRNPMLPKTFGYQTGRLAAEAVDRLDEALSPVFNDDEVVVEVSLRVPPHCRAVAVHGFTEALSDIGFDEYIDASEQHRTAFARGRFVVMLNRSTPRST